MSATITNHTQTISSDDEQAAAKQLAEKGFVVLAVPQFVEHLDALRERFRTTCAEFPEYRQDIPAVATRVLVRGGFGALGNASSFHNPFVRSVRVTAHTAMARTIREFITAKPANKFFAQVPDRMMVRPARVSATSENWHRDIQQGGLPTDQFFGGWLNLSTADDYFICKAGTHQPDNLGDEGSGFAKIDDPSLIRALNKSHDRVAVPPGHMIVIDETILHQVNGKPCPVDKMRVFLAWRLTSKEGDAFPANIDALIDDQAVLPLKSGQIPPMWPATDNMYRVGALLEWGATNLKPCMIAQHRRSATAKIFPGQLLPIPKRYAPSLAEAGLPKYPAYEPYEKQLFRAKSAHNVPFPNLGNMRALRYTPY